mmetsp:Transcript_38649/g.66017  ORF Transcript_38649/g.66017 Transcript_38649/m.66017 type:complete len:82 (+) Transcript_38649:987-1232(+)
MTVFCNVDDWERNPSRVVRADRRWVSSVRASSMRDDDVAADVAVAVAGADAVKESPSFSSEDDTDADEDDDVSSMMDSARR